MSSSGSDSGDEDYVPSDCSQPPSEVESDGTEEDSDVGGEEGVPKRGPKGKKKGKSEGKACDQPLETPREEKEKDSEDIKKKSDSLWSDFLKDVSSDGGGSKEDKISEESPVKAEKKKITQVYEFAGEKVTVSKEVIAEHPSKVRKTTPKSTENDDNVIAKENNSLFTVNQARDVSGSKIKTTSGFAPKESVLRLSDKSHVIAKPLRSGASSLSSALDKIGKKNKLSTLEKSKLDWESYKDKEGISEEISSHNKGKSGYLDQRDFLEKTDLKQYELEKQLRNSQRRKL